MNSLPNKTLKGQSSRALFRPLSAVSVLTMVRMAVFPVVFGASLVILAAGFYNRRKLFPEVETINQRKAREPLPSCGVQDQGGGGRTSYQLFSKATVSWEIPSTQLHTTSNNI